MITLINYFSNVNKSVRVEVWPSIIPPPANPNENHHHEQQLTINLRYKSYCEGGYEFLLDEGSITLKNIIDESEFVLAFEEEFENHDVVIDGYARFLALDAIARGYVRIKETYGGRPDVNVVVMSIYVEVDDFDEDVQGHPMNVDEEYYVEEDGQNIDDAHAEDVRKFLVGCGVRFGAGLQSSLSDATCMICLESLSSGSGAEVASLPCNHVIHGKCLVDMVAKGGTSACPVCRFKLESSG